MDPVLKEVETALIGRTIQSFDLVGVENITKEFKIMLDTGTIVTIRARRDPAFGAVIDIDYYIVAVPQPQSRSVAVETKPITDGDFGPQTHPSWRQHVDSEDLALWDAANRAWPGSTFVQSVGENLQKWGSLTPKQRTALQNIVNRRSRR